MALVFPPSPTLGQRYPANPGITGVSQYEYDGTKWNVVPSSVSLGTANQAAFNDYQWSALQPAVASFLESDAAGALSWTDKAAFTGLFVALNNAGAFNNYVWPAADGTVGQQLTTDGAGNLSWSVSAASSLTLLDDISPQFDDATTIFGLTVGGTAFTPTPSGNILVFLGGVPQIPGSAYTISGATIQFLGAPLTGTTFYAISSTIL